MPYVLYCDIYKLYFLKEYDIIVWCEVSIGCYSVYNKKVKVDQETNSCEWFKDVSKNTNDIKLSSIIEHFPKDVASIPDIFINLYTGLEKDQKNAQRIGYIRLKAEEVMKWNSEPRWLHFKALDRRMDSTGSVLVNLQFKVESDMNKRVFKEKSGMDKTFTLHAHIVSGFELDPKNKDSEEDYVTEVTVSLDGKKQTTEKKSSRFPIWNEVLQIEKKLDMNLDLLNWKFGFY
jgi:hypothetical protein